MKELGGFGVFALVVIVVALAALLIISGNQP